MRTVHAYIPSQQQDQQQQQQQQQQQTAPSSSTNQSNLHGHSTMSGYPSVRHSLLRMHSQLRSAPNRRESSQVSPIDLSLYRTPQPTSRMTTRSTGTTTTSTTLRPIPINPSLVTAPVHTVYSNATLSSSSSSSSSTATSTKNIDRKSSSRPIPTSSPKLAYSYSNIEENLQCPLCIDRLRDPRALPCQHVFCCSCLKSIPSSNLPYPTIACPLCRRTFPYNGADQFPISYIHRQLLELIPKNYDVNGKCTKCQEKTSLVLCSCCDFLLCQKCFSNDRQKILDNIEHITQTCRYRLTRIDTAHNQILKLNETNRRKIQQIENAYETFEKKYTENKQTVLNTLHQYNEQINRNFWSKLNIATQNPTESFSHLLDQADLTVQKSQTVQFDDLLSLFYNLTSINEQLEQANTSIDTYDVQNLLKQDIQINFDEQISVHLNQNDKSEKVFPLIPSNILPRSTKRLRKTEPKRHVEVEDEEEDYVDEENSAVLKRMKVEYHYDNLSSPTTSILSLNLSNPEGQENELNDDDIIYVGSFQVKSPATPNFEELLQIINTNE